MVFNFVILSDSRNLRNYIPLKYMPYTVFVLVVLIIMINNISVLLSLYTYQIVKCLASNTKKEFNRKVVNFCLYISYLYCYDLYIV